MIVENGKYYLYRHVRMDKDQVFYIGIAKKKKYGTEYSRSLEKNKQKSRNQHWYNIVNKTNYRIEILLETDDFDFISSKEIEFIKLYGRMDLGTGTLCNLTDGGYGHRNYKITPEEREKLRQCRINKKCIIHIASGQRFKSIADAARFINIKSNTLQYQLLRKSIQCEFRYETDTEFIILNNKNKKIIHVPSGRIFNSIKDAAEFASINYGTFRAYMFGKHTPKKFEFKYAE